MYFLLLCKRTLKIYPTILIITLATLTSIFLAAVMILRSNADSEDRQKISIGIVGDTSDTFFDVGIDVIKDIDHSRLYIDFLSMTEDEAREALKSEKISGYLSVPDGFIYGIAAFDNEPAVYYIRNKTDSLGTVLTKEVIDTVAIYITQSQKAALGMRYYIRANGLEKSDSVEAISKQILTNVLLPRNELYESEFTGIADTLSTGGYYITGLLLFFLLLWGISCSKMFLRKDLAVPRFLCTRGMGAGNQIICEYLVYIAATLVMLLIIALMAGTLLFFRNIGIRELEAKTTADCIGFVFAILPAVLAICAMQTFMYEAVPGTVASILLQFLCAVFLGYLSGCFYPNYFFPKALRSITDILPPGAGFSFMRKAIISEFDAVGFFILIGYTVFFLVLSVIIRKKRMAGDGE